MRKISIFFWFGLISWGLIVLLRKFQIIIPFVNNHFTDLITVPMYIYLIYFVVNHLFKFSWKPDFSFVISSVLIISVIFEVVCPMISSRYTADWKDVVCYFTGGIIYFYSSKRKGCSRQPL